jgi:PLP dependent protein
MPECGGSGVMARSAEIAENLHGVCARVAEAAGRVGRSPDDVCLVAVSKTFSAEAVLAAWGAGQRHFGENRPEEGATKIPQVMQLITGGVVSDANAGAGECPVWHMIGHIQSRKASIVASLFDTVHSLDRLKIAQRLSACAVDTGREIPVLLECNVSGEASKFGYRAGGWEHDTALRARLLEEIGSVIDLPGLKVSGLMTMAPIADDPEDVRPVFASLRGLRDLLGERFAHLTFPHLSMGMTADFQVAIEEGATLVRVGRAIFGSRSFV